MNNEIWKDIKEYEGLYQVSNFGRVKSLLGTKMVHGKLIYINREKILSQTINEKKKPYLRIGLNKKGKRKSFLVHRLVAEAFIPNLQNKPQVNHKDGDKSNNCVENLEWCTNLENKMHAVQNNLTARLYEEKNPHCTKINQYNLDGILIKQWECIKTASKKLNISASSISNCCRNINKTAGQFIWRYANENFSR